MMMMIIVRQYRKLFVFRFYFWQILVACPVFIKKIIGQVASSRAPRSKPARRSRETHWELAEYAGHHGLLPPLQHYTMTTPCLSVQLFGGSPIVEQFCCCLVGMLLLLVDIDIVPATHPDHNRLVTSLDHHNAIIILLFVENQMY